MERIPFPEIKLFTSPIDVAKAVGRFILGSNGVPLHYSDHYVREHFQAPQEPVEYPHVQLRQARQELGWDSEGTY